LKKYFFTFLLFLLACTSAHASIEGRMFLELTSEPDNKKIVTTSLHKVLGRGIESKNIRDAKLNLKTESQIVLIKDLELGQEYSLEREGSFINISEIFKKNLDLKKNSLKLEISSDFCNQNCKANQYPYIQIQYSFNNPPNIELKKPEDNLLQSFNKVYFQWESEDKDGRLLQHMLEISKDRFFQEQIVFTSNWITDKMLSHELEDGAYFWRVSVRDNSHLENITVSDTFAFEISSVKTEQESPPTKPQIISPKNNFVTKEKEITLVAKTQQGITNFVLLNNHLIATTEENDINLKIDLKREGLNVIKITLQYLQIGHRQVHQTLSLKLRMEKFF
jgi:hypothetical protein